MHRLTVVDNHSVAEDLLTKGPVLDAGCRGFHFAEHFAKRGHPVACMDPDPSVTPPPSLSDLVVWSHFLRAALVAPGYPKHMRLRMTEDAEARHITQAEQEGDPLIYCMTIADVMTDLHVSQWDLVKLNVEGAEYDILAQWPGPISRQIVVSFHEHTDRRRGEYAIQNIVEHLGKWYVPIRHEFDERYCAGRNAWDSVFCLKELA